MSEAECDSYTAYEIESMEEQNIGLFGKMVKIQNKLEELIEFLQYIKDSLKDSSSPSSRKLRTTVLNIKNCSHELTRLKSELTEGLDLVSNFEILALIHGGPYFLYDDGDASHCSTIVWPTIVHDEQVLQQLDPLTYAKIARIQLELTKLITSTNIYCRLPIGHLEPIGRVIFAMIQRPFRGRRDKTMLDCILHYKAFNMESELKSVVESTLKLGKEIEERLNPAMDFYLGLGWFEEMAWVAVDVKKVMGFEELLHELKTFDKEIIVDCLARRFI